MTKKNPIDEARRYVENACETLREKAELDTETNRYEDPKYVRAAGHYLWLGTLMALDAVFHVRKDRRTHVDIDDYTNAVGRRDRKLLGWVNDGYYIMRISMGYDGIQDRKVCGQGINLANTIIDRCATMLS